MVTQDDIFLPFSSQCRRFLMLSESRFGSPFRIWMLVARRDQMVNSESIQEAWMHLSDVGHTAHPHRGLQLVFQNDETHE
jgi:hypothetical protein